MPTAPAWSGPRGLGLGSGCLLHWMIVSFYSQQVWLLLRGEGAQGRGSSAGSFPAPCKPFHLIKPSLLPPKVGDCLWVRGTDAETHLGPMLLGSCLVSPGSLLPAPRAGEGEGRPGAA